MLSIATMRRMCLLPFLTLNCHRLVALLKGIEARVQVLGLWGMGGIGKTTLAGQLFNSLQTSFQGRACFVGSVHYEAGCAGGLLELQRQLLQALGGRSFVVESLLEKSLDLDSGTHLYMALLHVLFTRREVPAALSMPGRDATSPLTPAA